MIKANFNAYSSYKTDSLYQWDINQQLTVNGLNISVAPEVHFINSSMDKAIVRQARLKNHIITVDIPNSLLQSPLKIEAYIGIYENDTFKVIELVEIPIIPKAKPADYQLENNDVEVYSFESLKNSIANMVTIKTHNDDKKSITARIDNIIAHNNTTDGNTELLDLRTDHKGNVWASAGTAFRGVVERLANGNWILDRVIKRSHLLNNFNYNGSKSSGNLDEFLDDGCYLLNGVFENSPIKNNTPFILVNFYAATNSPRAFQLAISYHNNSNIYWRVVSTATGGESWHDFSTDSVLRSYGADVIDTTSLSECTSGGSYMFSYGHSIIDCPFGKNAFILFNMVGTENYVIQTVSNLSNPQKLYSRIYKNGEVTEWKSLIPPENTRRNRVIVNFGDSIFGQYQDDRSISAKLATQMNATVINAGLGGTTATVLNSGLGSTLSLNHVVYAIVSNDWVDVETNASTSGVNYFPNTIETLKNLDFSTVTDITFNHGTNDWSNGVILENEDSSPFTYKSALKNIIRQLQQTFPNAKISVISVLNRFDNDENGRTLKNANGNTLEDFANAAKEVCKELFVNYINVFDTLGFNTYNREYYFGDSTVHPNENGNDIIAEYIAKHL